MKSFLGYLLLLIASYLFCVIITLGLSKCFNFPEPVMVATLAWAYGCIFITVSR